MMCTFVASFPLFPLVLYETLRYEEANSPQTLYGAIFFIRESHPCKKACVLSSGKPQLAVTLSVSTADVSKSAGNYRNPILLLKRDAL